MAKATESVLSRLAKNKSQTPPNYVESVFRIHHTLMKVYGWIPLEEFLKLPQQTVNNLVKEINEDTKREQKEIDKTKKKSSKVRKR